MGLLFRRSRFWLKNLHKMAQWNKNSAVSFASGEYGSGVGKGGGSGGSVREAGGAFGKMEAAREEEYFRRLQKEQLKNLHMQLDNEVAFHEQHIRHHKEAIERHKKKMENLEKEEELLDKK